MCSININFTMVITMNTLTPIALLATVHVLRLIESIKLNGLNQPANNDLTTVSFS